MDNQENSSYTRRIIADVKEYSKLQIDLLKLNLTEKLSLIISFIIMLVVGIILLLTAVVILSIAFVHWTAIFFDSLIPGYLILGGVFLIVFIIFYLCRNKLILNPIVRKIASILFDNDKNDEHDEK